MVIEIASSGDTCEKFQVHLPLTEQNASVDEVQKMLQSHLGFDVTLLDSKYLLVMAGETTNGKA